MKTLTELGLEEADFYRITVVADTNDADYIETSNKIDKDDLQKILNFYLNEREIEMHPKNGYARRHRGIRFETFDEPVQNELGKIRIYEGRYVDEEDYYLMLDYCPYFEGGFHAIVKIEVSPYVESVIF